LLGHVARTLVFWRRIPLVFDVQGSLVGELVAYGTMKQGSLSYRIFRAIESLVCRMPDVFMCSSGNSLAVMRDSYGVDPSKLLLTPDGADVGQFSVARSAELAAHLGLPGDRPIAVFSGSLLPTKGIDELKTLIRSAAQQSLPVHFLVIGYPEADTRAWLDANGYGASVTLTGQLPFEKLPDYLALADLAIEPKAVFAGEASGKLVNYMAAGLPVICFESPHNRVMLGDDGYYAPLEARELLPALREALQEGEANRRLRGERCRQRAVEGFSWSATAERIAERYRSLLGERATR
jgi:glycosyltransferase involved in cell wall biosynthesis